MIADKSLSDFMPKLNPEGEVVLGTPNKTINYKITKKDVVEKLTNIKDPEIGMNIYDLGLIYELNVSKTNDINISMTLTTVNCPVADTFPNDVAKELATINECGQIKVKLTFDPPWTKDMMSEDAKLALGF